MFKSFQRIISLPVCLPGLLVLLLPLLITACSDPVRNHSIKTFFFDGVPKLPSLNVLCEEKMESIFNDYYQARIEEALAGAEDEKDTSKEIKGSSHRPFKEKDCQGCHDFTKPNLLLLPADELCFKCHKNFIQGNLVHGPVAVSDCLACHVPHTSEYSSLLQRDLNNICSMCHREKRLTETMHIQVVDHNMFCVDCHDPHSGNMHYFLK